MTLAYFTAPWCQPCKIFGPVMDKVAEKVKVNKFDITDSAELVGNYGIMSVPTVILFDESNKEVSRFVGARTEQMVLDWISEEVN